MYYFPSGRFYFDASCMLTRTVFPPRRYAHLHGRHVLHPLDGRRIPIITDAELVDMSFGTGTIYWMPLC